MIKLPLLQKNAEILKNRRKAPRRGRRLLERLDDLCGAQDTLYTRVSMLAEGVRLGLRTNPWRVCGNLGSLIVLATLEQ